MPGALGQYGPVEDVKVALRKIPAGGRGERQLVPDESGHQVGPKICRRPSHDPVKILRETLRFHQRLAAAVRTAHEIGATRTDLLECNNEVLGNFGCLLERSVSEID